MTGTIELRCVFIATGRGLHCAIDVAGMESCPQARRCIATGRPYCVLGGGHEELTVVDDDKNNVRYHRTLICKHGEVK